MNRLLVALSVSSRCLPKGFRAAPQRNDFVERTVSANEH